MDNWGSSQRGRQSSLVENSGDGGTNSISSPDTRTPTDFCSRWAPRNPALDAKLRHMALQLAPLVQVTSGQVHPAFPQRLLNFWLLTDDQLDALADFYHQRRPCQWTLHYPKPMTWREGLTLEEKRRKMGKFIGLRGCETPIEIKTEEQILEEARQARLAEDDEIRRKANWYS